jgi:hypothetical protein
MIDELNVLLGGNPHVNVERARKVAEEIEELAMRMRLAELRRRLRQHKKATSVEGVSKAKQPKTT